METANSLELVIPKESDDTLSSASWCESEDEQLNLSDNEQEDQENQENLPSQNHDETPHSDKTENNTKKREDNEPLDRADIRSQTPTALISSATLGQAPQEGQTDSGLTREQKMRILKRLMREVNLEDTLAKYRCYSEPERKNDALPESEQLKSLVSPMSQQYLDMMEGDVLFMADRQYMSKLEAHLEKQYQSDMDKKEEERADLERQRMRRLMVEGIIGPEDLKEDGYMQGSNHGTRGRRGTIHNKNKVWSPRRPTPGSAWLRSKSAPEPKTRYQPTPQPGGKTSRTHAQSAATSGHAHRKGTPNKPQTPRYKGSAFNGDTQVGRLHRGQDGEGPREGRRLHFQRCFLHDEEGCNCDSQRTEKKHTPIKKYEDPIITQLKEEEITVDQMYALADSILPEDRPKSYLDDLPGGKKKMTAAQERKKREMSLMGIPRR